MEHTYLNLSKIAGINLKHLIKKSKYKTQEEFAFNFGKDTRTIGRWINQGINNLEIIEEIADFFNVDVYTILSM